MAAAQQILSSDFDNESVNNASDNTTPASDGRHVTLQNMQPITYSSPQIGGEGCGSRFSRSDALLRHLRPYSNESPKHTCNNCGKPFWRSDKLREHVSKGCLEISSDEQMTGATPITTTAGPPISVSDGAHPLRLDQFFCVVTGCDRVNGNGFFQLADLVKHLATVHLDQEQRHEVHSALQQISAFQSLQPNVVSLTDQPINGTQPYGLINTLWSNEQDHASQSFQPNVAPQLPQEIGDSQFQWPDNYLQPHGQDSASQYFQPDATAQAPNLEAAFENPEQDNFLYFDQQNGFY
ncbi:hypothetical protein ABKA04_003228 [Annulohypoxylon sp. FPYF3050]